MLWASCVILVLVAIGIRSEQPYFKIATTALAVVVLAYLMEGKLAACISGAIYAALMAWICHSEGFYAMMIFNSCCSLPLNIIAFFTWRKNQHGKTVAVLTMSAMKLLAVLAVTLVVCGITYLILRKTDSTVPLTVSLLDSLCLSASAVGTVLLSLRYLEQWYFFIAANVTFCTLWIIKTLDNSANLNFAILALIFVVLNIMSLIAWRKMERAQRQSANAVQEEVSA